MPILRAIKNTLKPGGIIRLKNDCPFKTHKAGVVARVIYTRNIPLGGYVETLPGCQKVYVTSFEDIEVILSTQGDPIREFEGDSHPGVDVHAPGVKLDTGKPRPGLVLGGFAKALLEVSKVGTFGAKKYSDNGWKSVKDGFNRYDDALIRHWLNEHAGETEDPESHITHLAHEAWNALARLEFYLTPKETTSESGETENDS